MKNNYRKIVIFSLLIINCIGLFEVCSAEISNNLTLINRESTDRLEIIKKKGVLTVLMCDIPPVSFIDTNTNQVTGIDIDILNEFAKELGVKVETKVIIPFPELFEKLNTDDSIDVAASGIVITDKRKELVAFTQPLYKDSEAIIVPKVSRINFKEDLKTAVVGVQRGSVYADLAEKWKNEGKVKDVKIFESIPLVLSSIIEGKVDAGLMDLVIAEYLLFKENIYLKALKPYTPEEPGVIGIAVRKSDVTLLNAMNKKIDDMKEDKTIKKILNRYGLNDSFLIDSIQRYSQLKFDEGIRK